MPTRMMLMPELGQFLIKNGFIYTVRKYKMIEKEVDVDGVGLCLRRPRGQIFDKKELEWCAKYSGFDSLDDWWKKIRQFIPNKRDPMYLYCVELL